MPNRSPAVTVALVDWATHKPVLARIRFEVFVEEQKVPADIELDEWDERSVHALASAEGAPIGTGRLLPDGHIGRMAVRKAWRGAGVGSLILETLMQEAKRRGFSEVVLSSQTHAMPFYARYGFVARGAEYDDAGIPHRDMTKSL